MNKNSKTGIKLGLSIVLVVWLVAKLDWGFILLELKTLQSQYIIAFLIFQGLAVATSAQKWVSIARFQSISFGVWEGLKVYLTGTFINNFLPSTIGGDIYRSFWLVKRGVEKEKAFSTVIFDRSTGLFVTLVAALIFGLFVWQELGNLPHFLMLSYLGIVAALITFIGIVFFVPRTMADRIPWNKVRAFFQETVAYRERGVWLEASFWSTVFMFFGLGVSNYILFLALGYTLPFLPFLGLVFLMALYVSVPLSINNLGVKEWAYGVLFVLLGVSFETAVTVALLSRFLQTGISLLALPAYLTQKKRKLTDSLDSDRPSQSVMGVR